MKLSKFLVEYYRGIIHSGWVNASDITAVVGKNEAGKTSLLKALWKLNPHGEEPYSIDREWPRGRRKERSPEKVVVRARFDFSQEEVEQVSSIDPIYAECSGIEIRKKYSGDKTYTLLPSYVSTNTWIKRKISDLASDLEVKSSSNFKKNVKAEVARLCDNFSSSDVSDCRKIIELFKKNASTLVPDGAQPGSMDHKALPVLIANADKILSQLTNARPYDRLAKLVEEWIPKFIYMDDHRVFAGAAQLDQVHQRLNRGQATEDDKTIILIMKMAGLDLAQEVKKAAESDREQRVLDMADASQTLTADISTRWRQKKYEVMFQADGHHFLTFVKDDGAAALVPLDERSKGFQWFFSFDMKFMYETNGSFKNSIILLDEPGLHLHAEAQRDLLLRFKQYAENNQVIYTTHLPFMIDSSRFDNIWVAEETAEGSKFHQNWESADKDARFTLQAALGISWSQSLFVGRYNLVVEGVTDFWILSAMSNVFSIQKKKVGLSSKFVVTSAGGATKAAYLGTLLQGQKLKVAVLLDSDSEGKAAHQQLVKNWILKDDQVLMLAPLLDRTTSTTIEDLFSGEYYLTKVREVYEDELKTKELNIKTDKRGIVEQVTEEMNRLGLSFNKGRVAKRITSDLANTEFSSLDAKTVENFDKIFSAANLILDKWSKS